MLKRLLGRKDAEPEIKPARVVYARPMVDYSARLAQRTGARTPELVRAGLRANQNGRTE